MCYLFIYLFWPIKKSKKKTNSKWKKKCNFVPLSVAFLCLSCQRHRRHHLKSTVVTGHHHVNDHLGVTSIAEFSHPNEPANCREKGSPDWTVNHRRSSIERVCDRGTAAPNTRKKQRETVEFSKTLIVDNSWSSYLALLTRIQFILDSDAKIRHRQHIFDLLKRRILHALVFADFATFLAGLLAVDVRGVNAYPSANESTFTIASTAPTGQTQDSPLAITVILIESTRRWTWHRSSCHCKWFRFVFFGFSNSKWFDEKSKYFILYVNGLAAIFLWHFPSTLSLSLSRLAMCGMCLTLVATVTWSHVYSHGQKSTNSNEQKIEWTIAQSKEGHSNRVPEVKDGKFRLKFKFNLISVVHRKSAKISAPNLLNCQMQNIYKHVRMHDGLTHCDATSCVCSCVCVSVQFIQSKHK